MNREIEFRAWDVENKKMVYDNENDTYGYWDGCQDSDLGMINHLLNRKEYIFMQYTGLKDKNGNKIFEGDIIDIHQTVNSYNQFVIVYNNYQFTAEYYNEKTKRRTHRFYEYDLDELFEINEYEKEIEVIGNIYEINLEIKGE